MAISPPKKFSNGAHLPHVSVRNYYGEGTHLDDRLGDLGRGHDAKRREHSVGFLLTQFVHQECAQAAASAPTEGVVELISLERLAFLSLFADVVLHVERPLFGNERRIVRTNQELIDEFGALCVD